MNVFWVLFLVLLNTIGNQGDPNNGLINFETGSEDIPLYIVSMRNLANCHICTGSIISAKWILTAFVCHEATHFLHGLREYENCTDTKKGIDVKEVNPWTYTSTCELCAWLPVPKQEGWKTRPKCKHELVAEEFDGKVEKLHLPPHSNSELPQTGAAVVGWSFDNSESKFVMKKIADVNITEAFSENSQTDFQAFCELGTGSPLIVDDVIYGFVVLSPCRFVKILEDVDTIRGITNIDS